MIDFASISTDRALTIQTNDINSIKKIRVRKNENLQNNCTLQKVVRIRLPPSPYFPRMPRGLTHRASISVNET